MKVYKVELLIIDHDELGESEIKKVIESTNYPNHCISPDIKNIECKDIGEWDDDHPLNLREKSNEHYNKLFKQEK